MLGATHYFSEAILVGVQNEMRFRMKSDLNIRCLSDVGSR